MAIQKWEQTLIYISTVSNQGVLGVTNINLTTDGVLRFTPSPTITGAFTVNVEIYDDDTAGPITFLTNIITVTIQIVSTNTAPSFIESSTLASVVEDSSLSLVILATDLEANFTDFDVTTAPSNGVVTISSTTQGPNGVVNFNYVPNSNYNGTEVIGLRVTDSEGEVDYTTVTISVTPANDPPTFTPSTGLKTYDTYQGYTASVFASSDDGDAGVTQTLSYRHSRI